MSWLLAALGIIALVVLHELGHFFAAKATGMRVEQLSLFFGPKVFRHRRGETEYAIGTIPLGGYAKITGMNPEEDIPPEVEHRAYYRQPVWKRIVVIAAGPAMNIAVAFVILFVLAFGIRQPSHDVGGLEPGFPAASKLQVGDRLVSVDGVTGSQRRIAKAIAAHRCTGMQVGGCHAKTPAEVRIVRDGRPMTIEITPRYDPAVHRTRLGFSYATRALDPSVPQAAKTSGQFMWRVTTQTVGVVARIFQPQERQKLSGIVGVSEATHQAVQFGARAALTLLAVISLSLALINLFPFLPLDGGHIFWSLVEKVRGRPVAFSVIERASVVGFVLVLLLFVVGLSNDIGRLTGNGFTAR